MKISSRSIVLLFCLGCALGVTACSGIKSAPIRSSGRSGCNNINMSTADMRDDPSNGLPPLPH